MSLALSVLRVQQALLGLREQIVQFLDLLDQQVLRALLERQDLPVLLVLTLQCLVQQDRLVQLDLPVLPDLQDLTLQRCQISLC